MAERVILADCCEDWIIEWGGYYKPGRAFRCPECATEWTKTDADVYRRGDGRVFQRRTRVGPQASYKGAPVLCVTSDASTAYSLFELETAQKYQIPVVTVVYNNNCWGTWPQASNSARSINSKRRP